MGVWEEDLNEAIGHSDDEFEQGKNKVSLDGILTDKETEKVIKKAKQVKAKTNVPGVVYLGRIPHGFYENEMKSYFSQFGNVLRLRLSRNKKTGKSKHFAFIEFENVEIAEIVAETMNNYLLFNHLLKCEVIPHEKVHPELFKGCEKKYKPVPWYKLQKQKMNKKRTMEEHQQHVETLIEKERAKRKRLAELGIEYDFDGYEKELKNKA